MVHPGPAPNLGDWVGFNSRANTTVVHSTVLQGYTLHYSCHNSGPGVPPDIDESVRHTPMPGQTRAKLVLAKMGAKHRGKAASKSIVCTSSGDKREKFFT